MKDKSIWLDGINRKKFPKLSNDIMCDIVIIGGGITGLSCAYFLKDLKKKIVLVERNKLCTGTTAKSTGKLTYLQDDKISKIENIYNKDKALLYLNSQKDAISLAKKIIIENDIKCNLDSVNSYIFCTSHQNKNKILKNYNLLKDSCNIKKKKKLPIQTKCCNSLEVNDTFVFHPVKFVLNLSEIVKDKIDIYENTNISSIKKDNDFYLLKANNKIIKAKQVILACHYPFFLLPYLFPFKTSLEKSFLAAGVVEKTKPISAINVDKSVISLRYHKDKKNFLLYVGETNSLDNNVNNIKKKDKIIWNMRKNFTPLVEYCWSNYDILTWDYMPLIGEIDNNMYLATGYNTWGMTNGILAGKIISDLIDNKKNKYSELFDPKRNINNIPKIINFNIQNSFSFINTKINKNKNFYYDNVKIVKENGVYYGVYIDEDKKEHKVLNLCPHMKCSLSFNYQTKTWDCPCHGSSFDVDGNLLYGPASHDIKVSK